MSMKPWESELITLRALVAHQQAILNLFGIEEGMEDCHVCDELKFSSYTMHSDNRIVSGAWQVIDNGGPFGITKFSTHKFLVCEKCKDLEMFSLMDVRILPYTGMIPHINATDTYCRKCRTITCPFLMGGKTCLTPECVVGYQNGEVRLKRKPNNDIKIYTSKKGNVPKCCDGIDRTFVFVSTKKHYVHSFHCENNTQKNRDDINRLINIIYSRRYRFYTVMMAINRIVKFKIPPDIRKLLYKYCM